MSAPTPEQWEQWQKRAENLTPETTYDGIEYVLAGNILALFDEVERLTAAVKFKQGLIEDISRDCEAAEADLADLRGKVQALAATDGVWKGEKHVRLTRRNPHLGCDITESYVKVADVRALLNTEESE